MSSPLRLTSQRRHKLKRNTQTWCADSTKGKMKSVSEDAEAEDIGHSEHPVQLMTKLYVKVAQHLRPAPAGGV